MDVRPGIELANLTDVGCERENNEDYFCYWEPESEEQFSRKGRLAIVADGMGGAEGGQIASRLAVDAVRDTYVMAPDPAPQTALVQAFQAAHDAIRNFANEHPELYGMGTTCTALAITDGQAYFAHVGDSRLYLVRNSGAAHITQDHTSVNQLIQQGVITPEEAATHPQRHVLTAALGAKRDVKVDFSETPIRLNPDDVLVLCTDGLWEQVADEELHLIIQGKSPSEACKELIRVAKTRGGADNITVQILRVQGAGSQAKIEAIAHGT
jgi:serine/threonine protein phosphatase PrpC